MWGGSYFYKSGLIVNKDENAFRYREKDELGNVLVGQSNAVKANNNLVISSNNSVVVEGLDDIYVIESGGKVLVGHKSNVANVKELKNIV